MNRFEQIEHRPELEPKRIDTIASMDSLGFAPLNPLAMVRSATNATLTAANLTQFASEILEPAGYTELGVSIQAGMVPDLETLKQSLSRTDHFSHFSLDVPYLINLGDFMNTLLSCRSLPQIAGHVGFNINQSPSLRFTQHKLRQYMELAITRPTVIRFCSQSLTNGYLDDIVKALRDKGHDIDEIIFAIEINAGIHSVAEYIDAIAELRNTGINAMISYDGAHIVQAIRKRNTSASENMTTTVFETIMDQDSKTRNWVYFVELNAMASEGQAHCDLLHNVIDYATIMKIWRQAVMRDTQGQMHQPHFIYEPDPRQNGLHLDHDGREQLRKIFQALRTSD